MVAVSGVVVETITGSVLVATIGSDSVKIGSVDVAVKVLGNSVSK